jgi:cell division septation protein DedD
MAERQDDGGHELRLEGVGLVLGGGVLLALLVGAFFLGRWVERQRPPAEMAAAMESGPLDQIGSREGKVDANQGLDHFDGAQAEAQPPEPERELNREKPAPADPTPTPPAPSDGDFFVQVVAMRDRGAATEFIDGLKQKGYSARLFSEGEGQGRLFKVRVGGFPTRQAAGAARDRLRTDGHPGAFLWPSS